MLRSDILNVLEIVPTMQGEGKYNTFPVVLVRLAGCNLRCSWCDTKYSWSFEGTQSFPAKHLTSEELVANVVAVGYESNYKIVLITGGEPMLWQYSNAFQETLRYLKELGYKIHIETNGTMKVLDNTKKWVDFFAVSPKQSEYMSNYNLEVLSSYRDVEHIWKFVVGGYDDAMNVVTFVKKFGLENDEIYIMPEGAYEERLLKSMDYINSDECKKILSGLNYSISERLQIEMGFL